MGFTGNKSEKAEKEKEEIDPRCVVKFRPADDWEGEYGFDWFREGDYGEKDKNMGRIPSQYQNKVGRYFGNLLLCTPEENFQYISNKDEFSDEYGSTLYSTGYTLNGVPFYYLRAICSNCSRTNCRFHRSPEEPMIDENTGNPLKVDPDVPSQPSSLIRDKEVSNRNQPSYYEKEFKTKNYETIQVGDNSYYFVPTISLFYEDGTKDKNNWGENSKTVNLLISGKDIDADIRNITLEFESSEGIEKPNDIEGSTITNIVTIGNTKYYITSIDIQLSNSFSKHSVNNGDGAIKVYAKSSAGRILAGKLIVEKCIPKRVDVVFVPFITRLQNSAVSVFKNLSEHASFLKRFLSQAHVIPNIYMYKPNNFSAQSLSKINTIIRNHTQNVRYYDGRLTGEIALDINNKYFDDNGNPIYDNNGNPTTIEDNMGEKLEEIFNQDNSWLKYRNAYKIFLFGEKGRKKYDQYGYFSQNLGQGNGIPSKAAVVFSLEGFNNTTSTICHELLHCLGLWHSFSNNSPYTIEKAETSNIMDYPVSPFELQTLWKWQWDIIRKASGVKPLDGNVVDKLLPKIDLPKVKMK